MALRVCLVTPFSWSQPHDVNEHVAGIARELRALGHREIGIGQARRAWLTKVQVVNTRTWPQIARMLRT